MKFFYHIFLITALYSTRLLAQDQPNSCHDLIGTSRVIARDFSLPLAGFQRSDIIGKMMDMLQKIMALKFKSATIISDNRRIYGEYVSLKEHIKDLDNERTIAINMKGDLIERIDRQLKELDPKLPARLLKKRIRMLEKEKKKELKVLDARIKNLHETREERAHEYHKAMRLWLPFEDQLNHLASLEEELLKSLEHLKALIKDTDNHVGNLTVILKKPVAIPDMDLHRYCVNLTEELLQFAHKQELTLEKTIMVEAP